MKDYKTYQVKSPSVKFPYLIWVRDGKIFQIQLSSFNAATRRYVHKSVQKDFNPQDFTYCQEVDYDNDYHSLKHAWEI